MNKPIFTLIAFLSPIFGAPARADVAEVKSQSRYSSTQNPGLLAIGNRDSFGKAIAVLPDLDGDGVNEIAVGMPGWDADQATNQIDNGGVWILFPFADGTLRDAVFVTGGLAGHPLGVPAFSLFGTGLASLGDIDGDGSYELAVSASGIQSSLPREGFVDILSLNTDGSVAGARRIDSSDPVLFGSFGPGSLFGCSVSVAGDVDSDGIQDLAVGSGSKVWILFMRADGSVRATHIIDDSELVATFGNNLPTFGLGTSIASLGDLDGDGLVELALGVTGAVQLVSLSPDGSLASLVHISVNQGGFEGSRPSVDKFGAGLACIGDLDGDGRPELAVGAFEDDDGALDAGAVWILFLGPKGDVDSWEKICNLQGGLGPVLNRNDAFGRGIAFLPAQAPSGAPALLVGAALSNAGGRDRGELYRLEIGATDPAALFSSMEPSIGTLPYSVAFSDQSLGSGALTWLWDFGDGMSSTVQNPTHDYIGSGSYDVSLTVTNAGASSTRAKTDFVCVDTSGTATLRNGSGLNPSVFTPTNVPIIGQPWRAAIDASAIGASGFVFVYIHARQLNGVFASFGELLIDPSSTRLGLITGFDLGSGAIVSLGVPPDPALIGFQAYSQAYIVSAKTLTNAIDLTVGN